MSKRNINLKKACPFEAAMDLISGKWKGLIIYQLMKGPMRFNELKASMPLISEKVMAQQIKALEIDDIIIRKVITESPLRVEYSLSENAEKLKPAFKLLKEWGQNFAK